jgi:hypothetical protein
MNQTRDQPGSQEARCSDLSEADPLYGPAVSRLGDCDELVALHCGSKSRYISIRIRKYHDVLVGYLHPPRL